MWQSVTISPVNRRDRNGDPGSAAWGGLCFFVLAALHLLIPALVRFAPPARRQPEMRELSLSFESFSVPETAAPTPPPAVVPPDGPEIPPALPETVTAETAAVEAAAAVPAAEVPAEAAPESAARAAFPESAGAGAIPAHRGNGAAAGGSGTAAGGTAAGVDYMALIMRRLEEKKVYPLSVRKRGIEGDVTVEFTIGRNGAVTGITLADSAHRFLGQAAVETVRSASPFPAPALNNKGKDYPVRVTIRYRLEEAR
jgi:TonB family protein